jgi:hypothetical protein
MATAKAATKEPATSPPKRVKKFNKLIQAAKDSWQGVNLC